MCRSHTRPHILNLNTKRHVVKSHRPKNGNKTIYSITSQHTFTEIIKLFESIHKHNLLAKILQMARVVLFWHVTRRCKDSIKDSVALVLIVTMETGKAPQVAKGTRMKIWFFFFWQNMRAFLQCGLVLGVNVGVHVYSLRSHIGWESSDLVESANLLKADGITWPCPRPQPSPFYPSGMPLSASLSSAPATHNMAPEWGQKKMGFENIHLKI